MNIAPGFDITADRYDLLEHVLHVAGDRHLPTGNWISPFSTQKPAAPRE